jgi:hypothetical protein
MDVSQRADNTRKGAIQQVLLRLLRKLYLSFPSMRARTDINPQTIEKALANTVYLQDQFIHLAQEKSVGYQSRNSH